jgi:DNA-binding NarL/FixJ family response regulator
LQVLLVAHAARLEVSSVFAHDSPYEAYDTPLAASGRVRRALRVLFWLEDSLLRDVLVSAIRRVDGIELVLATDRGVEALEVVGRHAVDLVAFDADGGSMTQLQRSVEAFRAAAPEVRLVALTSSSTAASIRELLAAGLDSAISKSILTSDFGYVLRQSGRNTFFESMLGTERPVIREAPTPPPIREERPATPAGLSPLTSREREILALVSKGTGNKQIAKQLWVTEQTVKFHLSNIYRKLQVSNRTEASRIAHASGLISLTTPLPGEPVADGAADDDLRASHA